MLTASQTLRHLLQRRLIEPRSLVRDSVRITSLARRNHNFHVTGLQGPNYFVKQGRHDLDVGSIANEALAYRILQEPTIAPRLGLYVPHCFEYDAKAGILTLESLPNAEDLHQYHLRRGRIPKKIARDLGKGLGLLHEMTLGIEHAEQTNLRKVLPTVFCIHRPPLDLFKGASGVGIQLTKLIQRHRRIGDEFEKLIAQWKTESVIHGDVKLTNWVAYRKLVPGRIEGVKLIDWEFAGIGDPRWDVGSVFSNYLALWLFSIPIARGDKPDQLLDLARFPLDRIQPAMRIFWNAYRETRHFDAHLSPVWLTDAIRFAAACLIQTAYEFSKSSNSLTAEIICLTQLSLNMLQRPKEAATQLLGLSQ